MRISAEEVKQLQRFMELNRTADLKNPDDAAILKKLCLQNQERERTSWQD